LRRWIKGEQTFPISALRVNSKGRWFKKLSKINKLLNKGR